MKRYFYEFSSVFTSTLPNLIIMQTSRRDFLKLSGAMAAGLVSPALVRAQEQAHSVHPELHLLNRITWGPRPEEVKRMGKMGRDRYLERQLHPERIDDAALDARLRELPILAMDRRTAYRLSDYRNRCREALIQGMVLRATYSKRQLLERMVDFWTDHFNVPSRDLEPEVIVFQREAVRAHALGRFRDLLLATAQSAAMLSYLDNTSNKAQSPNENYARELLELHTLGVDGGYSEQDVKEVARAFTGWTVDERTDTGFYFRSDVHDTLEKHVLGHTLPADRGIEDGLHVLSLAADHPSTARFICTKLCVKFVADEPPHNLVESAAQVWTRTGGDVKEVLRHIFLSEHFAASAGQKLRRPLEFFVGALRATGTEVHDAHELKRLLEDLAHVPYGWEPPDGYPDKAAAWVSSSGLLARWNVASALTHTAYSQRDSEMSTQLFERVGSSETVSELVDAVAFQVFARRLDEAERGPFIAFASDGEGGDRGVSAHLLARKLGPLYGLMLASPAYQWS